MTQKVTMAICIHAIAFCYSSDDRQVHRTPVIYVATKITVTWYWQLKRKLSLIGIGETRNSYGCNSWK